MLSARSRNPDPMNSPVKRQKFTPPSDREPGQSTIEEGFAVSYASGAAPYSGTTSAHYQPPARRAVVAPVKNKIGRPVTVVKKPKQARGRPVKDKTPSAAHAEPSAPTDEDGAGPSAGPVESEWLRAPIPEAARPPAKQKGTYKHWTQLERGFAAEAASHFKGAGRLKRCCEFLKSCFYSTYKSLSPSTLT